MNRKDFFKKLGITLGAVAITPTLLASLAPKEELGYCEWLIPFLRRQGNRAHYTSSYSLADFEEIKEMLESQNLMVYNVWNAPF